LLGHRGVGATRPEGGKDLGLVARMREGQKQHRDAVGECCGDAGKGVLGSWAVLHHEDAGGLAVGHTRKAIRHVNADPLLAADDRADSGGDGILDQGRGWEAEECRYALTLKDLNDGICAFHPTFPLVFVACL
jgi:hypothetical protein